MGQTARQSGSNLRQSMWETYTRASSTQDSMAAFRLWRTRRKSSNNKLLNLTVEYETLTTRVQTGLHREPHFYDHSRIRAIITSQGSLLVRSRSNSLQIHVMVVGKLYQLEHEEESRRLLVDDQSALQTNTAKLILQLTTLPKME